MRDLRAGLGGPHAGLGTHHRVDVVHEREQRRRMRRVLGLRGREREAQGLGGSLRAGALERFGDRPALGVAELSRGGAEARQGADVLDRGDLCL